MDTWVIILIVLGCLIAIYLLGSFIIWLFLKAARNKAYKALDELVPYEKERFQYIAYVRDEIEKDNYHLPKSILDVIENNNDILSGHEIDMQKVKSQDDFLILFFQKYLKEKKLISKEKYVNINLKMSSYLHMDTDDKESPYDIYDKKAFRYNSLLGMTLFTIFLNKSKFAQAPIL
ncbi:MAG: hypothetical protein WCS80_00415 [Bacilli bacterium]